ncbi:AraC family transcriptional regulator [Paenibacillus sp. F6_3S_P_1C]|uniref:AraC family transcriptional regulator n=2 Tax=Paenibacillus vandeheii TaxID=3035917 RepID=A0ABT8J836_9BACL|nr:AraC family transcriptional regulator [Paenibacillus vandeheii]
MSRYRAMIQQSLFYIETHLHEEIGLEEVASEALLSPYHYHRVFRNEVGMTVVDYIRNRRMSLASTALRSTNAGILDISLACGFESQEAFTRAFCKLYGMPPGRFRKLFDLKLFEGRTRGGELQMNQTSTITGWMLTGSHPQNYEMGIDPAEVHQGKASGYLKAVTPMDSNEFATMMQQFRADKYVGKRMKLSGFVKTELVDAFCGLWMRVDNNVHDVLQFDNMHDRPITGTQPWNQYHIVLDVPKDSAVISFGVILNGKGKVWVDSFRFEEVDSNTPLTHIETEYEMSDEPMNLSFEE